MEKWWAKRYGNHGHGHWRDGEGTSTYRVVGVMRTGMEESQGMVGGQGLRSPR